MGGLGTLRTNYRTDKGLNKQTRGYTDRLWAKCTNSRLNGPKRTDQGSKDQMRYLRTGIARFELENQWSNHMVPWKRDESAFFSRDPMIILKFPREILYPAFVGFLVKIKNRNDSKISFFVSLISLFLIDWKVKNEFAHELLSKKYAIFYDSWPKNDVKFLN